MLADPSATFVFPAAPRLATEVVYGLALLAVYVGWSRAYPRLVDPGLRGLVGAALGTRVVWVFRSGSAGRPLGFGPAYDTWSWGVAADAEGVAGVGGAARDGAVYILWLLLVRVVCGLWPIALFLALFLGLGFPSGWVAIPLLVALPALYTWLWTRYVPAGPE